MSLQEGLGTGSTHPAGLLLRYLVLPVQGAVQGAGAGTIVQGRDRIWAGSTGGGGSGRSSASVLAEAVEEVEAAAVVVVAATVKVELGATLGVRPALTLMPVRPT